MTTGTGDTSKVGAVAGLAPVASRKLNIPLALSLFALPVAVFAAAWLVAPGWNFVLASVALTGFLLVLGLSISGTPFGVLINERNLMSLSQMQAAVWTVVVLAGYLTTVVARIHAGVPNAAEVAIPEELWLLMGISASSLVGTPLILSTKKSKTPDDKLVKTTADQLKEDVKEVEANKQGSLYANTDIADARFADMFQGDEIANTAHVDLAKVQMFYFTLISVVVYVVLVTRGLVAAQGKAEALSSLPQLSEGLIALLAISHGGYLASKMGDRSNSKG